MSIRVLSSPCGNNVRSTEVQYSKVHYCTYTTVQSWEGGTIISTVCTTQYYAILTVMYCVVLSRTPNGHYADSIPWPGEFVIIILLL